MAYIDLNRTFAPIGKDAEPDLAFGPRWGLKYGGWLTWKELLSRRRVVLLAEASSGKTEEFKNTVFTYFKWGINGHVSIDRRDIGVRVRRRRALYEYRR